MFIIPIYLFSEIFPGVSRGPSVLLAPGPIHQFGRHWQYGTKVRRYNWHSAGSLAGYFQWLNIDIFQIKYMEAILSNCTRKLLCFDITHQMPIVGLV